MATTEHYLIVDNSSYEKRHPCLSFGDPGNHSFSMASPKPVQAKSNVWMRSNSRNETEVEVIPGTEFMKDAGGTHFVHAHNSAESIILIPQPTKRLDDPLVFASITTQFANRD